MGSKEPRLSYSRLEPQPGPVLGTWMVDSKNWETESQTGEGVPRHYLSLIMTKLLLPMG